MKAVVQRVLNASVTVEGEVVSRIGRGLLVLIGVGRDDTAEDVKNICQKISSLRIFPDIKAVSDDAPVPDWKASIAQTQGEILCVSQFTLLASTKRGSKPDFHTAMKPGEAKVMYESCLEELGRLLSPDKIKDGVFGAMMAVASTNDGPVTILLDTKASS